MCSNNQVNEYFYCVKLFSFVSLSRPEELSRNYLRVECSIKNYPPISNTLELVQRTLIFNEDTSGVVCPQSVTFSGNYMVYFNIF